MLRTRFQFRLRAEGGVRVGVRVRVNRVLMRKSLGFSTGTPAGIIDFDTLHIGNPSLPLAVYDTDPHDEG